MKTLENISLNTVKITGFIVKSPIGFTIYSSGKNGVIVCGESKKEAEGKFNEAMRLVYAVRNLAFYNEAIKGTEREMKKYAKDLKTPNLKFEYVES